LFPGALGVCPGFLGVLNCAIDVLVHRLEFGDFGVSVIETLLRPPHRRVLQLQAIQQNVGSLYGRKIVL
jgi:hypothetical protein